MVSVVTLKPVKLSTTTMGDRAVDLVGAHVVMALLSSMMPGRTFPNLLVSMGMSWENWGWVRIVDWIGGR